MGIIKEIKELVGFNTEEEDYDLLCIIYCSTTVYFLDDYEHHVTTIRRNQRVATE